MSMDIHRNRGVYYNHKEHKTSDYMEGMKMTKAKVMKMSRNELKDFIIEVRTRVEMGIASENLIKLGIVAIKRYEA
jgi:hypothetical protein